MADKKTPKTTVGDKPKDSVKDELIKRATEDKEVKSSKEDTPKIDSKKEEKGDVTSDSKDSSTNEAKNESTAEDVLAPSEVQTLGDDDFSITEEFVPGKISERNIANEMKTAFLDYSMSVIVSRALPESKDGLKPSQRRILVAMNDLALHPSGHYRKSAKIAGDTSGNYHPHGESVIYPTMVKLAQDFSTRYPLVDGQGNFGSLDGDPPAAMRYTEAKMEKITSMMLQDLDRGTVTWIQNYDGTRVEPTVLPTLFPNLVCNGSDGIAVGMATKIPPHNLTEVVEALRTMLKSKNNWQGKAIYNELRLAREKLEVIPKVLNNKPADYLENYIDAASLDWEKDADKLRSKFKKEEDNGGSKNDVALYPMFESEMTPGDLIKIVPGPDFPTGAMIYDQKEILNAYATGRGRVLMRAKASIEEGGKNGRMHIIVTEIPYQVNKARLIEKIADLVKDVKIKGIADIRDESTVKEGVRVVIILKRGSQPKTILNKLFKYTQMQMSFSANMISLVEQEPQLLGLRRMLELFINFRLSVVIRRYEYILSQARYRGHILEGLLKALDILDEVIAAIRASKTQEDAKTSLITKFEFTEVQAQAILEMQLRRLAALEREKLQDEYKEISANIKEYNRILGDEAEVQKVVDGEFKMLGEKYGDDRRTKVVKGKVGEMSEEDLVASEDTFITISHQGYIKRVSPDTYKSQKRGGKGVMGQQTKEEDFIEHAFLSNTHDDLLMFTNMGRVFKTKVHEIPEFGRTAKGLPAVNLVQLEDGELITSVLTQSKDGVMSEDAIQEGQDLDPDGDGKQKPVVQRIKMKYLFMATKKGTIKKTDITDFDKIRQTGLISIKLGEGDELKWVKATAGDEEILLITKQGRSIRFKEEDVRPTGRATMGVRGMKFKNDKDEIIGMEVIRSDENQMFTISENGYGKMTKLKEYPTQGRGGSGVFTFKVREKTGNLVVARTMDHPDREIVVMSEKGMVMRSGVGAIPVQGRQTSGVKVMNIKASDSVAAMAIL
jgi:DNA gyrase subunit A